MVKGVDYSFSRPSIPEMVADGVRFVFRYVDYPGAGAKGLKRAELDALHAAGLGVGLYFEAFANGVLGGASQGETDANAALTGIKQLDWPTDRPIFFAVDFNVSSAQHPVVLDYFRGVRRRLPPARIGAYAQYSVLEMLKVNGLAYWYCQPGAFSWSGRRVFPELHVRQFPSKARYGGQIDPLEGFGKDFGVWFKGDDMTPEQEEMLTELWRRTGAEAGREFDLLKSIQNDQTALQEHVKNHSIGVPGHTHEATVKLT